MYSQKINFLWMCMFVFAAGCGDNEPTKVQRPVSPVIGQLALEITGTDSAGQRFSLDDYRGKVVLLKFWKSNCGFCKNMLSYDAGLMKRLENKPFVFLGVNFDLEIEPMKKAEKELEIPFRSWWDGTSQPITKAWWVTDAPTYCLIDHNGILRHATQGEPKKLKEFLDKIVNEAIAKAENQGQ